MQRFELLLRKMFVKLFTNAPYRIRSFDDLYANQCGQELSQPESLNLKLKEEIGFIIAYPPLKEDNENGIIHNYVNGKKRYIISGIFKEPTRIAYSLSNGVLFGPLGLVYDKEKRSYIEESAKEWEVNLQASPYTNVVNFPPKKYLKGITVSCLTNDATAGFYHFIFEALVKLFFYDAVAKNADHILFNAPASSWKIKWLERAKVDLKKIIWVENSDHIECEQLIFSNRLIKDQEISNWCLTSLKKMFNVEHNELALQTPRKVIFISRKSYIRHIEWEQLIQANFPFIEFVDLTLLNADDTIRLFGSATHIIGPHGAGLSNIFLCRPNTRVLEVYPLGKTYQPCYYRAAIINRMKYSVIYVNFQNSPANEGFETLKEKLITFLN